MDPRRWSRRLATALAGPGIMLCLQLPAEAGRPGPDISVSKTGSPDPVRPGATITYTITATNNGPETPVTMEIRDDVPSGTTFVSASGGDPFVPDPAVDGTGLVHHTFDGVSPGDSVTMTMVVMVNAALFHNSIVTNTASAGSSSELGDDPDMSNNEVSIDTTVLKQSDISTIKTESDDPISPGKHLTYTITATNNGPDTPDTIQIQDVLPNNSDVTFLSATGGVANPPDPPVGQCPCGTITHEFPGVSPGGSVVLTMVVYINAALQNLPIITNTASSSSNLPDPAPGNNQVSIETTLRPTGRYHTMAPCRVLDTRSAPIGGGPFVDRLVRIYNLSTDGSLVCPIPETARAVSLNVTAAEATASGEFNLFAGDIDDDHAPGTVIVSFQAGINRATNAVVEVSSDVWHRIKAKALLPGGGAAHLIIDINGYFD